MNEDLRGFPKRFIRGALAPGIDVAVLSMPAAGTARVFSPLTSSSEL